MKTLLRTVSVAAALSAAPALAADFPGNPTYSPPAADYYSPRAASTWTGFYAGVIGGYGAGRFTRGQGGLFGQVSGGDFGLTGGFMFQSDRFVGGIEVDYLWANISNFRSQAGPVLSNAKVDSLMTARVRVGYTFDRLMLFGTVGLAGGNIKASVYDGSTPVPTNGPFYAHNRWRNGWAAGLGLEYAITSNVSAKAEYMYVHLRSRSIFSGAYSASTGMDLSLLRMGLNYRF